MIGVEKYGQIGLLAHAPDQRRRLGDANEGALALGNPDHHRHLQVASRRDNRIEGDEVREIEVTHRDSPAARIVETSIRVFIRSELSSRWWMRLTVAGSPVVANN